MRIAVVPEQFPRSSDDIAGIFTRDYIEVVKRHCEVIVVLAGDDEKRGLSRRRSEEGVEYITCTPAVRGGSPRKQRLGRLEVLYRIGKAAPLLRDIDLIHAHGAIFHGVPAASLGQRLGVPVVLTVHTGPFEKLLQRQLTRYLTRRTLERVACVCTVSDDVRARIERAGIKPERLEVTYNPVDTGLFRPSSRELGSNRRIVFAGRLEEYKGALRVAEAFARVSRRLPDWRLVIAGSGPETGEIRRFVGETSSIRGRVDLHGAFTKRELADLFASSDVFVYPSRYESFGLVLAEAMAAGLPVVAPDRGGPLEIVPSEAGVFVPPDDIDAIAAAIEDVALNLSRFDRAEIRRSVEERFGFDVFGQRLLRLYRSVVELDAGVQSCAG